ncbi:flavin reductase family protein [Ornithinimicrobium sp. Arc0846-15]|nr:flavin reductase family protein [Ornithinimicrobium laminariae]
MPLATLPARTAADADVDIKHCFRNVASSAWVITGTGSRGPVGFTAISVVSVSMEPALVSFNISRTSSSLSTIARSGSAALHLLSEGQNDIATRYARDRSRRFVHDGVWGFGDEGLPEIHGAASRLVVTIHDLVDAGDSLLVIGRVTSQATNPNIRPLVHHAGEFVPVHRSNGASE